MSEQEAPSHTERKNSGLGIASFVVSITAVPVLLFVIFVIAAVVKISMEGNEYGSAYFQGMLLNLALPFGIFIAQLVALGLGIGGLFQKKKEKKFAVLGAVISSLAIVVMVAANCCEPTIE